ncbi:TIGR04255 family protein [Candidatus Poriferisodalis sp.]|uniref:TIGR04255 family protein n=1 Tax=Candidatus Poriferisodalis sp. TaxID=3101277 RepID=UPI003B5255D3
MLSVVSQASSPRPDYIHPPVTEVALAVQFAEPLPIGAGKVEHMSEVWEDMVPVSSIREPLPPLNPYVGSEEDAAASPPTQRLWLTDDTGNRVVQFQSDRLTVNWQKSDERDEYPRFEAIRAFFVTAWQRLADRLEADGLEAPEPNVCDVLYMNQLGEAQGWSGSSDTAALLAPWNGSHSDEFLPEPEMTGIYLHYHLPTFGWLNVEAWEATDDDENGLLALYLQSRGHLPIEDCNLDGALAFMDEAREWIVRGFTSVTTEHGHRIWGRFQ